MAMPPPSPLPEPAGATTWDPRRGGATGPVAAVRTTGAAGRALTATLANARQKDGLWTLVMDTSLLVRRGAAAVRPARGRGQRMQRK